MGYAWDSLRQRLLVFGGSPGISNEVWALDQSGIWNPVYTDPAALPPVKRTGASAIYDAANDRLIVFGGRDLFSQRFDVWELPLHGSAAWNQLSPAGLPPPGRSEHAAIYDAPRQRMVIFGGTNGSTDLRDTWELTLGDTPTWTKIQTPHFGPDRSLPRAAFDSNHDRMLMFGGENNATISQTWALSLTGTQDWTLIATGGPTVRNQTPVVYDPADDQLVLFGGNDGAPEQDAWALSLSGTPTWHAIATTTTPAARAAHAAVLDPTRHAMLVFGGNTASGPTNDAWSLSLSGSPEWTPVQPHGASGLIIPGMRNYAAAFDPIARQLICFGGELVNKQITNAIVTFSLSDPIVTPVILNPPGPPSPRFASGAAWDPLRDRMLVFGGGTGTGFLNDVWEYRPRPVPTWTQLSSTGPPPQGRMNCGWVYDALNDRMLLIEGYGVDANLKGVVLGDVWELRLSGPGTMVWYRVSPTGPPPSPRWGFVAVADATRHRILVFGGGDVAYNPTNTVYSLDVNTEGTEWSQVVPLAPGPSARMIHAGVIDPIGDDFVAFGGFSGGGQFLNDVWALSLGGTPAWTELHPNGSSPIGRDAVTAIYDPVGLRMIVPCGFNSGAVTGGGFLNDVWSLSWDAATPATASLIDSHAEPGLVRLNWFVTDAASAVVTVQRQHSTEAWTALGAPTSTASDRLTFEDRSVVAGESYRYRLSLREGWSDTLTDPVEITVPSSYALELAGATPNPAIGSNLRVTLSLPRAMPARLDLIDVSGRRVASRDLSGLAPGRQTITLGDGVRLAPGLYVIRLEADGHALAKKALVVQ